jgi:epoxyqueuosine reductase
MDKAWAVRSGLGWQGKNSMLLNKNAGSFFFLGELILDLECDYDTPLKDLCGSCTRCIDACPTGAIYGPGKVDGSKCISYFTIELRNEIPAEYHEKLGNWMYGCDICQDVCPWNRRAPDTKEPRFAPRQELISADESLWKELNLEEYRRMFKGSAVKRTKFEGLSRNIAIVTSNRKKESEPHHE